MRFIAAIICFVLAFGLIALGFAQRTIFAEANSVTASRVIDSPATVTVIDSRTLKALEGSQSVQISGSAKIFAAYGRTADVRAWVADAAHNRIGFDSAKRSLTSTLVPGKTSAVPNPQGSDLWLGEYTGVNKLDFTLNVPNDISILIVSDGTAAAPSHVAIRWPLDNRTPWSGPLIVAGLLVFVIGIVLYLLALWNLRRSRGPRRKSPRMPKVPRQRSYKPRRAGRPRATTVSGGRRANRRRMIAVVPALAIGGLLLSGCTAQSWPEFITGTPSATPTASAQNKSTSTTATPSVAPSSDLQSPAVTVPQLRTIVARIAAVATKADADKNLDLAKTRFGGAALDLRSANYAIRKVDATYAAPAAIPAGIVQVTLPQQTRSWPRTVFTVVQNPNDKTVPPVALMLEQQTPRDDFKVEYATALEANTVLPHLAPADVGAPGLDPDVKLLALEPSKVAMAYGDILEKGAASASAALFDLKNDALVGLIGMNARKALQDGLVATASMSFANSNGPYRSIVLGSINSGAIIAVSLNETVTVKPVGAGFVVNTEGAVKSLSGITGSTKGTEAVYGDQLLFYVPSGSLPNAPSKQKITLLGFTTGLVSAKELP